MIWVLGIVSFVSASASVVGGSGLSVGDGVFYAVPWFLHVLSLSSLSAIFRRKFAMCVWEKIISLLVLMHSAAAQMNRPQS